MIPDFDIHGVVPPVRPGALGHSPDRAPYLTDMLAFCQRFGGSSERRAILRGLLELREALRVVDIGGGLQWLDGSFAEDVERLQDRPPNDIDVVTFCAFGTTQKQEQLLRQIPEMFEPARAKSIYKVDHYFVQTDALNDPVLRSVALTRSAAYWYSMWSHQRDTRQWKGFVEISLNSNDDEAKAWLDKSGPNDGGAT